MLIAAALHDAVEAFMLSEMNSEIGANALMQFWSGTPPATCEDSDSGTLIVQCICDTTCWGSIVSDVSTMNAVADGTAIADGTITYVRVKNAGSSACINQFEVGADFTISGQPVTTGDTMTIDSITCTFVVEGA